MRCISERRDSGAVIEPETSTRIIVLPGNFSVSATHLSIACSSASSHFGA